MIEIKDFEYLFKCVVDDVYNDMLRYKEQHKDNLGGVVLYEFLRLYWLDKLQDFDDYIMDMCEPKENAWSILMHYETDPVRLLYGHSDPQYSLRQFSNAVAKEATDKILS